MRVFPDRHGQFAELCRLRNSWGLYLSWEPPVVTDDYDGHKAWVESLKAMQPLDAEDFETALWNGGAIVLGTREEVMAMYAKTHGDDGPCDRGGKKYGECRLADRHVYALTCRPDGEFGSENT